MGGAEPAARERQERERGCAADGWGQPVSGERRGANAGGRAGGRQAAWAGGARRAGGSWAENGPTEGKGGFYFFFFTFYFLFLIFISFISFSFEQIIS
jgi:hypothetical protein